MALTDRLIKTSKTEETDLFLNDGRGLYLRVRKSGSKNWLYRYKAGTKTNWLELGDYPSMSLVGARLAAQQAKVQRRSGIDPVQARHSKKHLAEAEKQRLSARLTINELFDRWYKIELSQRKDDGAEVKRAFEKDVLPQLGQLPAADVTRVHISNVLDVILARGARRMANQQLANLRQMFGFAFSRGIVENDPTHRIKKTDIGGKDTERDRVLSAAEILELSEKIKTANLYLPTEHAIWIALSTCCRIGELLSARWEEVDLENGKWKIPDTKNNKAHVIYLSVFTIEQFKKLHQINHKFEYCYPDRSGKKSVSSKTVTKQVGDRQLIADKKPLSRRSSCTDALLLEGGKWTPHDLRRTGATLMVKLGLRPDIVERCLNHAEENKVKRIYQRHDYAAEQKEAWHVLGRHLTEILNRTS